MEETKEKFTESEMLVGTLGYLFVDGFCFVVDLIPIIGWVITPLLQWAGTFSVEWWEKNKGGGSGDVISPKRIGKYLMNAIPWLPTLTGIFLVSALIHNSPAKIATAYKAASAVKAAKGVEGIGGKIKAARQAYKTEELTEI